MSNLEKCGFKPAEVQELYSFAEAMRKESFITKQIELPGPTGERNFMFFAKRGIVACYATKALDYARQIISAVATGNSVVLPEDNITDVFAKVLPEGSCISNQTSHLPLLNVALISAAYPDYNARFDGGNKL